MSEYRAKPTGLKKWFMHAPAYLYRAGLGFVFGKRFLMVEHTGRTSGKRYETVLEVAGRNEDRNEWISTAGRGPTSDWYRNLEENGADAVWIGRTRYPEPSVRFLEPEESAAVFARYEASYPRTAEKLLSVMGVSYDGTNEGRVAMMRLIPMVAFRPAA
ncbi:MAG: nitroreductase family deazaflavin-dependent oxidoreductase [Acidimicrobiia bacterium]|nr:nitroreductase family deazaflavin-dependent oxidoreductase [Acidimicrobiia bacterium]